MATVKQNRSKPEPTPSVPQRPPAPRTLRPPPFRRLRAYAFDPSLATQLDSATINEVVVPVMWEELEKGPVGEYVEVVDYDPASKCFYAPVDLSTPYLLAQDGLPPSEGSPAFHQQMVYAVVMTTIRNFERALGRLALWAPQFAKQKNGEKEEWERHYVQRLRVYPHALRAANAYYSPQKKALLFGYFPGDSSDPGGHVPGAMVFTCLSHDVVAHETTHALLDGLHRRFIEPSNPDSLAFHEAFADICALFQHFSFPAVLRHQISKTRGDLQQQSLLGELAQQVGQATGQRGALRSAIGQRDAEGRWQLTEPKAGEYLRTTEPHERGAFLVAAVFDAYLSIYKSRVADLLRIATGGTGRLPEGQLQPDLVNRLADEAAKSAQRVLQMCIRALDYCPPVDITFGEYLRALITADYDLVPDDPRRYRVAVIEAFRRRGIYPRDLRTLSEESLRWHEPTPAEQQKLSGLMDKLRNVAHHPDFPHWDLMTNRAKVFVALQKSQAIFHDILNKQLQDSESGKRAADESSLAELLGLDLVTDSPGFEVHCVRPARRLGPDGQHLTDLVVEITQRRAVCLRDGQPRFAQSSGSTADAEPDFWFRGGCTLLINPEGSQVRYVIVKRINSTKRLDEQAGFVTQRRGTLRSTYFGFNRRVEDSELFAALHSGTLAEATYE